MKKRFTLILASMLLAMGAWAETTVYKVNEATTTLTDGTYVLVAMSDKGTGPCYYSSEESGNRLYRYDVNKEVQVGGYIDGAQYIWTIDETTTNGTQKITVTNVGDPTKAFPVDADRNKNFQGTGVAELIPELHTINGVDYLALTLEDTSVGYIHANAPGGNPNLSYWNSYADGGTCVKFRFYPVEAAVVADRTITYTLTDMAGNSYEGTFEGHEGDVPTFTGVADYSLDNIQWGENSLTATITFPYPVSKVDGATNATLLSSYYNAKQWHAVDGNVLVQTAGANLAELDYWMWAIYPTCNDGAFTFLIKNIATGLYVTANSTGSKLDTSGNNYTGADGVVTLTESGTAFSIPSERDFAFTINDATAYLSINSDRDTDVNLGVHTGVHNGTNVLTPSFADLSAYKVTIGSTGYSTLYTPIKVAVPDGVTAYTGELNGEWLTLTEVENVIPANTAVVLQGDANTYTFNASSAEATEIENNDLTGSTETVATSSVEGTVYTLQSHNGGVAFKRYTGTNLTGFKAYLAVESQAQAIRIRKGSEEGTTSIENAQLTMDNENVVIYDLQGRRVEKMEKGIYIVNGKKIIK